MKEKDMRTVSFFFQYFITSLQREGEGGKDTDELAALHSFRTKSQYLSPCHCVSQDG